MTIKQQLVKWIEKAKPVPNLEDGGCWGIATDLLPAWTVRHTMHVDPDPDLTLAATTDKKGEESS